jgi:hypothetical protein
MKKDKKKYTKPALKKNEPLVNITFATGNVTITAGSPASGAST